SAARAKPRWCGLPMASTMTAWRANSPAGSPALPQASSRWGTRGMGRRRSPLSPGVPPAGASRLKSCGAMGGRARGRCSAAPRAAGGQRVGAPSFSPGAGETGTVANFDMPLELRNQVTRVEIAGERSAGAVHLLDARSQWHRVGLLSGASREEAQPLLAPLYYIERALL